MEEEKLRIYISGKISGIEEDAPALFRKGTEEIDAIGHIGINPMEFPHDHDKTWESYMKEDIMSMCQCDGLYMLRNWTESKGAIFEHYIAKQLGMKILYER